MELQMDIAREKGLEWVGSSLEVLCEGFDDEMQLYFGRSYMDAPDIDTKVYSSSDSAVRAGEYLPVRITGALEYDLIGEIQHEPAE